MESGVEDWSEFVENVHRNSRGHADYFSFKSNKSNRNIEEVSVVEELQRSLDNAGENFIHSPKSRGENEDPPDCEATTADGGRIGIEVTELVDFEPVKFPKKEQPVECEPFDKEELAARLQKIIKRKDSPAKIKGGPYSQYLLIVYCDDPRALQADLIEQIRSYAFEPTDLIDKVFFLMSYDPWVRCCPFVELILRRGG